MTEKHLQPSAYLLLPCLCLRVFFLQTALNSTYRRVISGMWKMLKISPGSCFWNLMNPNQSLHTTPESLLLRTSYNPKNIKLFSNYVKIAFLNTVSLKFGSLFLNLILFPHLWIVWSFIFEDSYFTLLKRNSAVFFWAWDIF